MKSTAKVEGIDKVMKNVKGFQRELFSQFGTIVKEAADIVRDEAKAKAPEDTGALRRGIISAVTWDKDKSKAFAGVGMDSGMNDAFVKYSNGKRYYYPSSVEYGFKPNKDKTAQPFLRPALKKKRPAVRKHIAARVGALVQGAKMK